MGEASLPSCHCVVLAVDCDAHGAEPGGPAGLTKPQQPAAGSRRAGVPQERRKAKFWRGVTNRNTKTQPRAYSPKIRLKSCRGGTAAKRCQVCQRQLPQPLLRP